MIRIPILTMMILLCGNNKQTTTFSFPLHHSSITKRSRSVVRQITIADKERKQQRQNTVVALNWGKISDNNDITTHEKNDNSMLATTTTKDEIDNNNISNKIKLLKEIGIKNLPYGLYQTLLTNAQEDVIQKRFWIVDNSGSMSSWDGHRTTMDDDDSSSRWLEVDEIVTLHAHLSSVVSAPTEFRLLNLTKKKESYTSILDRHFPSSLTVFRGADRFRVGYHSANNKKKNRIEKDRQRAQSVMVRNGPSGKTPLSESIQDLRKDIIPMLPQLQATNSKVCVIIATDGCNHNAQNIDTALKKYTETERNQELVNALQALSDLSPSNIKIIIRLCTDDKPVVDFYNSKVDAQNHDLDVLDDHVAEAKEVYNHNPWLNYALILHRIREMGQADNLLLDLLDERPFTSWEIQEFCQLLFWGTPEEEEEDWNAFLQKMNDIQQKESYLQWNPITQSMSQWIDTNKLASLFSN